MGLVFRNLFGQIDQLRRQQIPLGGVGVLQQGGRYLYYLVTKQRFFEKPSYETLHQCLEELKSHMLKHHVKKLHIPKLGCVENFRFNYSNRSMLMFSIGIESGLEFFGFRFRV